MKRYKSKFKEAGEDASAKAIKDLIALNWGEDEDHQNTALQLFKGLIYANNPVADKFIQKVSDFTSGLKDEDFKEGVDTRLKEVSVNNEDMAVESIIKGIDFLGSKFGLLHTNFIRRAGNGIMQGLLLAADTQSEEDKQEAIPKIRKALMAITKNVKDRIG